MTKNKRIKVEFNDKNSKFIRAIAFVLYAGHLNPNSKDKRHRYTRSKPSLTGTANFLIECVRLNFGKPNRFKPKLPQKNIEANRQNNDELQNYLADIANKLEAIRLLLKNEADNVNQIAHRLNSNQAMTSDDIQFLQAIGYDDSNTAQVLSSLLEEIDFVCQQLQI